MSEELQGAGAGGGEPLPAVPPQRLPGHAAIEAGAATSVHCAQCGRDWSVHKDLAGSRVRCECGAMLAVGSALATSAASSLERLSSRGAPDLTVLREDGLFAPPRAPREVALDQALEADALEGTSNEVRQRWTTRTLIELLLMMLALGAPMVIVMLATSGERQELFMPFSSLASSVLVICVGLLAPGYTFGSLVLPKPRYVLEALGGWLVAVLVAILWMWVLSQADGGGEDDLGDLKRELGLPMALFVIALCPGIFEELAFRGLLQGRLAALVGRASAIAISGVAFGWAHGLTPAFPIHVGLGLYLGWLRARAGTLIPGMLLHAFYNATIVCLA